jgi:hypothetical protein
LAIGEDGFWKTVVLILLLTSDLQPKSFVTNTLNSPDDLTFIVCKSDPLFQVYFEDFTRTERFIDSPSQNFKKLFATITGSNGLGNFIVLTSFE